jgi:hypothetical protein
LTLATIEVLCRGTIYQRPNQREIKSRHSDCVTTTSPSAREADNFRVANVP